MPAQKEIKKSGLSLYEMYSSEFIDEKGNKTLDVANRFRNEIFAEITRFGYFLYKPDRFGMYHTDDTIKWVFAPLR